MYGSILSNLEDTIGKIDDFFSFERKYVHEDIVYSIHDPSGQTGKVTNVEMIVDLESVDGTKLKDINSKKLKRIGSILVGDYVVSGSWVGKADKIMDRVTVLFDDSSKSEFIDNENLVPISSDSFDGTSPLYFPGQRVKIERTNWFCGTHKHEDEGTVLAVDAGFVYVNWLECASFLSERRTPPESFQSSRDLISLSGFTHSNWQLDDRCLLPGFQELFIISKIKSKLDVLWQNGIESKGLDSNSVGAVNIVDPNDFYPHQFVLEKTSDDQETDQGIKKWGVVKIVDANEKTVKVKWEENGIEETVSAYELIEHPEFSFCHGDVVFGLDTCLIGIVMGLKNGRVEVKWAAGFTSQVGPHEISRIDKSEGVSTTPLVHNGNIEPNQEKSEHVDHPINPKEKDLQVLDGDDKACIWSLFDSTTFNVPRATFSFLSGFATRLFGSSPYTSLSPTSNPLSKGQRSDLDHQEESVLSIEIKENKSNEIPFPSSVKNVEEFVNFAMVNDCSNHHFVDHNRNGLISNQVKRSWLKKVQQEWNILKKDLPETIYVRVFEERMDLLQAAIVGAPGTPYHDGLFFFDIFFPPEYPHEPPMVHYVSGGLRVNPNLYESGRVCLSLLNTWTGTETETWNPKESTILQVLLSLQALVLNKNPYFNEAGYEQQIGSAEGEKNSCSYNENTFLVSCKNMIYTLRNPPKHFEALIEEHFRKRYMYILMACKAYMEGVPIGYAFEDQIKSSMGFKIALSKLFPKLVEAFNAKGFHCSDFVENVKNIEVLKVAMK